MLLYLGRVSLAIFEVVRPIGTRSNQIHSFLFLSPISVETHTRHS